MLNEVKFSEFLDTGKQVTHINLGDFIKLYVNHRPAFGLASKDIQQAFEMLGYKNKDYEATINRDDLLLLLQHKGVCVCVCVCVQHAKPWEIGGSARVR